MKKTVQLDLLTAAPRTRVNKLASTSKSLPRTKLDKSQLQGAEHLKVKVVTEQFCYLTDSADEVWRTLKTHATFYGATAHRAADHFIELMEKGLTPQPDNICVADGASLNNYKGQVFIPCVFPEPIAAASGGGGADPRASPATSLAARPAPSRSAAAGGSAPGAS